MIREIDETEYSKIIELGKKLNPKFSRDFIGNLEKVLVYEENGKIIAFIEFLALYEVVEIINIIVEEKHRNRGIGTLLLNKCINKDTKEIILEVKDNNEEGLKFYLDNGFKIIRTINNYYKDGDAYIMERII